MTKPACRPILSSASLLNRDTYPSRSNPSFPQTQELNSTTDLVMPALVGRSHPTFSRHYYGLPAVSTEQLITPKSVPTWQDLGAASDVYDLPARYHGRYESRSNDDYSCSFEGSVVGREAGSPWNDVGFYEASPPTFLPTSTDAYHQYTGSPSFADVNSRWNVADYRSHFGDYPTPQSNLSLSPPQQSRGKALPHGHNDGQYIAASNAVTSQDTLDGLLKLETSTPQQFRLSASGEDESAQQHDDEKRQALDECYDSDDEDGSVHCEPYAQLIFRALKSAPGHRMVLKDIYRWFEKNTDKARKSSKGWQNSIRHNLSMNGVRLPCILPHRFRRPANMFDGRVSGKSTKTHPRMKPKGDSSGYWSLRPLLKASNRRHGIGSPDPTRRVPKRDNQLLNANGQGRRAERRRERQRR